MKSCENPQFIARDISESKLLLARAGRVFRTVGLTKHDHDIDPKRHQMLDAWVALTYSVTFCYTK